MKIAVVIPGMARCWRTNSTSIFKALAGYDVSVFIAIFDRSRRRCDNSVELLESVDHDGIMAEYKPIKREIMSVKIHLAEVSIIANDLFKKYHNKNTRSIQFITNSIVSQMYSWKRVALLIDDPSKFDFVLKTRFDVRHDSPIIFEDIDDTTIVNADVAGPNGPGTRKGTPFEDVVFYGRPNVVLNLMSKAYDHLKSGKIKDNGKDTLICENILKDFVQDNGWKTKEGSYKATMIR